MRRRRPGGGDTRSWGLWQRWSRHSIIFLFSVGVFSTHLDGPGWGAPPRQRSLAVCPSTLAVCLSETPTTGEDGSLGLLDPRDSSSGIGVQHHTNENQNGQHTHKQTRDHAAKRVLHGAPPPPARTAQLHRNDPKRPSFPLRGATQHVGRCRHRRQARLHPECAGGPNGPPATPTRVAHPPLAHPPPFPPHHPPNLSTRIHESKSRGADVDRLPHNAPSAPLPTPNRPRLPPPLSPACGTARPPAPPPLPSANPTPTAPRTRRRQHRTSADRTTTPAAQQRRRHQNTTTPIRAAKRPNREWPPRCVVQ